jgi:hypothetical protein
MNAHHECVHGPAMGLEPDGGDLAILSGQQFFGSLN